MSVLLQVQTHVLTSLDCKGSWIPIVQLYLCNVFLQSKHSLVIAIALTLYANSLLLLWDPAVYSNLIRWVEEFYMEIVCRHGLLVQAGLIRLLRVILSESPERGQALHLGKRLLELDVPQLRTVFNLRTLVEYTNGLCFFDDVRPMSTSALVDHLFGNHVYVKGPRYRRYYNICYPRRQPQRRPFSRGDSDVYLLPRARGRRCAIHLIDPCRRGGHLLVHSRGRNKIVHRGRCHRVQE